MSIYAELTEAMRVVVSWKIDGISPIEAERLFYVGMYCSRNYNVELARLRSNFPAIDLQYVKWILDKTGPERSTIHTRSNPGFLATAVSGISDVRRLYLSIRASKAYIVFTDIIPMLGRNNVRCGAKVLANPQSYYRTDSAVIYVERSQWEKAVEILLALDSEILKNATPLGTCVVRPGVAWADSIDSRSSFGQWLSAAICNYVYSAENPDTCGLEGWFKSMGRSMHRVYEADVYWSRCKENEHIRQ